MVAMALPRLVVAVALVSLVPVGPAAAGPDSKPVLAHGAVSPTEAAARATLDRWLAAQNQGKYDDYAALYASDFAGIKRVGKTAKKMTRAAWLKDRKAMFKARLDVTARDLVVTAPPAGAATGVTLDFTQTWVSGSYGDVGPKRIVLDASNSTIVSEELLSSRPILTEVACASALFPGASLKRKVTGADDGARPIAGVAVRDLGGRWACKVMVTDESSTEVALGVLAFGKRWDVKGRLELRYDVEEAADAWSNGRDGEVELEPLALHATIPTVRVVHDVREYGPEHGKSDATTTLYRVDGDELVELLSWKDGGTTGEGDDVTRCELDVGDKKVGGWPDLTLTCTRSVVQWALGENEPTESTEVTRYRWDGSTYAER